MAKRDLSAAIRIAKNLYATNSDQPVFRCVFDATTTVDQYREVCAVLDGVAQSRYHKTVQTLDTEHAVGEIGMVLSEAQHSAQAITDVGL